MKLKKIILFIVLSLTITTCAIPFQASATINNHSGASCISDIDDTITPNTSDIIEYKYRVNSKGQLQYRRWNSTKGYWVDPLWINVN